MTLNLPTIFKCLTLSVVDLLNPRILALILVPFLLSLLFWGGMTWFFFDHIVNLFSYLGNQLSYLQTFAQWLQGWNLFQEISFSMLIAITLLILSLLPLSFITALLITSTLAMPFIVSHVSKFYYPDLKKDSHRVTIYSLLQILKYSLVYFILWMISIPLWLIPVIGFIVPLLLTAYLNSKVFVFDALSEHASKLEIKKILSQNKQSLFILGFLLTMTLWIPFFFIIFPVYAGLCFTHYCLFALADLRKT